MATLTGQTVASTYDLLLKVNTSGIDGTLRTIQDGLAADSALELSTGAVKSTGTLEVDGVSTLTGATTVTGALAANGGITCDTDKFTVADTTGNTTVAGTLGVTGVITATGGVTGDVTGGVTGNVTGNVTGDVTGDVKADDGALIITSGADLANSSIGDGVTATTQAFSDDSTKVATTAFVEAAVPTGSMVMWYTASAPTGWLICDGATFDAGTYPALNTLLGGNTLPDLTGNVPVGKDGATFAAVGDTGGVEDVTLTGAQSGTSAHQHTMITSTKTPYYGPSAGGPPTGTDTATASALYSDSNGVQDSAEASADSSHTNLQPYLVVNFIIKT